MDRPEKKGELRKKRQHNQATVLRHERDRDLQMTAVKYGSGHYRTRQILDFDPGNIDGYEGIWKGASPRMQQGNNDKSWKPSCLTKPPTEIVLTDNKVSFDVVKRGLQRFLGFLEFLDGKPDDSDSESSLSERSP